MADEETPATSQVRRGRLRRWPRLRRYGRWSIALGVALLCAALVSVVTIDLGPALRGQAEQQFANYLDRPVRIGRLSTYLLPGRFLIEDLVIDGLSPGDRPFFHGERIVVSTAWLPLLQGEVLVDDVDMQGWRMLVESFGDGRQSFPRFARGRGDDNEAPSAPVAEDDPDTTEAGPPGSSSAEEDARPRRIVTTVRQLRAHEGEFIYEDHGVPWSVIARNVDLTLAKEAAYGGRMSFRGGTVRIGDFEPMTTAVEATYALDGGLVDLTRLDLRMTGFDARLTGRLDLLGWPEQTYDIHESSIDLAVMKEVFFADDNFTVAGDAEFRGSWHVFDGGRDLTGRFSTPDPTLQGLSFAALAGELLWTADRFAVTEASSAFYGGGVDFSYTMEPLGAETPALATFDARYDGIDLGALLPELGIAGVRPHGTGGGRTRLDWPVGDFADRRGDGQLTVAPPAGTPLLSRATPPAAGARWPYADAPFAPAETPWRFPIGAEIEYAFGPGEVRVGPSWAATPLTSIAFEGRTAWGRESHLPFRVLSADWQEADRVMVAIMTAFGRPTGAIEVAGRGEMQGVMRGAFLSPRIEARFDGDDIRAWNVDWGRGAGSVVVEGAFLDVSGGTFGRDRTVLTVDGRFALGPPPEGADEDEIDARFGLLGLPAQHVRDAFRVVGYPIDGPLTGTIQLLGVYRRPYGYGTLTLGSGVAYGEPFDRADAGLRFDGDGVWLDGFEVRKGDGEVTGAMYIRWNGTYSVNADGRGLALETARMTEGAGAPVTGALDFSISGAGAFETPRYALAGTITDLTISGASVGQVSGRVDVDGDTMQVELEAASPSLAVSGSGRITLAGEGEAELHLRATGTRLDPFVRALRPDLAESIALIASGTVSVEGPLRHLDRLAVGIEAEQLDLTLFDYAVGNDGPIRLSLGRTGARGRAVPSPGGRYPSRPDGAGRSRRRAGGAGRRGRHQPGGPAGHHPRPAKLRRGSHAGARRRFVAGSGADGRGTGRTGPHPSLLAAARAGRNRGAGGLRPGRCGVRRSNGGAGRRPATVRRQRRSARLRARRLQPHGPGDRDEPALPGGHPVDGGRRPDAHGVGRRADPGRHRLRAGGHLAGPLRVGHLAAGVAARRGGGRAGRPNRVAAARLRPSHPRPFDPAHQRHQRPGRRQRRADAERHVRTPAAVRQRRYRARAGLLRGPPIPRHAG